MLLFAFFVVIFIFRAEASHLLLFTIQIQSLLKLVGGMLTLIQLGKRSLVLRLSNYFLYDASRKKKNRSFSISLQPKESTFHYCWVVY